MPFAYPVPWSSEPATNHIDTPDAYRSALAAAGFTVVKERNRRDFALQSMQQRVAQAGQPIGLPVVMGATAAQKLANMRAMIERGVFAPMRDHRASGVTLSRREARTVAIANGSRPITSGMAM